MDISITTIQVEEFFLQFLKIFLKVEVTMGSELFQELEKVLVTLQLDVGNVRGQGYDNNSNMKEIHKGVQKRQLDKNPRAFYTPCVCHSLNLVPFDMVNSCNKATSFF